MVFSTAQCGQTVCPGLPKGLKIVGWKHLEKGVKGKKGKHKRSQAQQDSRKSSHKMLLERSLVQKMTTVNLGWLQALPFVCVRRVTLEHHGKQIQTPQMTEGFSLGLALNSCNLMSPNHDLIIHQSILISIPASHPRTALPSCSTSVPRDTNGHSFCWVA